MEALAIAVVSGLTGILIGHWLGYRRWRLERLRELYADLMLAAIRMTPTSLGLRFPVEPGKESVPDAAEVDALTARVMVEPEPDEDKVRQAFVGVQVTTEIWRIDRSNKAAGMEIEGKQLRKNDDEIRKAVDRLQATMRGRLAAGPFGLPNMRFRWPWKRTRAALGRAPSDR